MVVHDQFSENLDVWKKAVPHIQRLLRKYPEYVPYGLGDVFNDLLTGDYVIVEFPNSFAIVTVDRSYLHCVLAAGFDGSDTHLAEHSHQLYQLAIDAGFKGFKFSTPRDGWKKIAPLAGFRVLSAEVTYIYGSEETESV